METKLTKTEMAALAPYELEMRAAKADYLRSAGREGLAIMHKVYERVTGNPYTETDACGHCQLKLQRFVADWYFKTRDEEANIAEKIINTAKDAADAAQIVADAAKKKTRNTAKKGGKK